MSPWLPFPKQRRTATEHQPKVLHLGSSQSSVHKAAAPANNPATDKILGFSGDVTEMSKAVGLPRAQLGSKMSAGRDLHAQTHGLYGKSPPTHCVVGCGG